MIRLAMLSFWHVHAKDYAQQAIEHPETEIVAVWDELPERGKAVAERLSVPFISSLDELLAQQDIEGVIVDTPTNMHHSVMTKAAKAGKHIFTEKVLALTLHEANRIIAQVREANVKLVVSLPRLNDDYTLAIHDIISKGLLGDISYCRVHLAHNGALEDWLPEHFYNPIECGGGAMTDLGCHPMYLTRLFLGAPESVSAHYGYVSGKAVEDNAIAVLKYENGSLGVAETGFMTGHSPFSIELHGTLGSLIYGLPEEKVMVRTSKEASDGWKPYASPAQGLSSFEQWVKHIQEGTTADENIKLALDLTKLIEAANVSSQLNTPFLLKDLEE